MRLDRLNRLVPERFRRLFHEALKFGAVGGVNAVINFAVFNALILTIFAEGQLKANVIATVVATTASYLMNRHWTFRHRSRSAMHREYVLFFFLNGVGLVIELAVLGVAKYGFALTSILALNIAKIIGVSFGTVFRFWAYRSFVFRALPEPEESVAAAEAAVAGAPGPVALNGHELAAAQAGGARANGRGHRPERAVAVQVAGLDRKSRSLPAGHR